MIFNYKTNEGSVNIIVKETINKKYSTNENNNRYVLFFFFL